MHAIRAAGSGTHSSGYTTKRALDLALCAVTLPIVVLVGAFVALLIRLDSPGPIFIRQTRTGRNGSTFRMYKFRTMVQNAEELKASLMHLNVLPPPDFKIPDDPRITRVGRILRKTSLDELPQLLNIAPRRDVVGRSTSHHVRDVEVRNLARRAARSAARPHGALAGEAAQRVDVRRARATRRAVPPHGVAR